MYQRLRRLFVSPNFVIATAIIAGFFGLALATVISNPYTKVVPPLVLVGGATGILIKNNELYDWKIRLDPRIPLAAYFTTAAVALFLYASNGFSKVFSVYALVVVMFLLTIVLIFVLDSVRARLGLIVSTGIFYRVLVYYASPIQMGADALFHNRAASLIASSGSMAPLAESKYWYAPVYHLFTASGVTALDVPVRTAAFLLITIIATLVPAFVIYQLLERTWNETTGLIGGFLFITADRVLFTSIHTTTTTLGVVMFSLIFLYTERYLESRSLTTLLLFTVFIIVLTFTHQLSMFAALVGIGVYLVGYMLWEESMDRGAVQLLSLLFGAFLFQSHITKYGGPSSDTKSFLLVVSETFIEGFLGAGSRAEMQLPASSEYVISGSPALSVTQTIGTGLFLALGVVGTVYWMNSSDDLINRMALDLSLVVVLVTVFLFIAPMLGVQVFLPDRWFSFLYFVLAILAAPGVLAILSGGMTYRQHWAVGVVLLFVIFAPITVFMTGNAEGSPDNPVFDDSPGAGRLASTHEEVSMYQHIDEHGSDARVLADMTAWQLITRHYNHPAAVYTTDYGEQGTSYDGQMVIVNRAYANTNKARYDIIYRGNRYRVVGSFPDRQPRDSIVYSNGPDNLVWRVENED